MINGDIGKKSIIFFTTKTSATGSMQRIYGQLRKRRYRNQVIAREYADKKKLLHVVPDLHDKFIVFNHLDYFNKNLNLSDYRFIINYRDPRDRACNSFHWGKVHPGPDGRTDHLEEKAKRYDEMGIDRWVLKNHDKKYYDNLIWLLDNLEKNQYIVQSYAKICLDFDLFVKDGMKFFDIEELDLEAKEIIELNRVENLSNNPKWIGNKWVEGSDTAPGRYKRELKPETIRQLTDLFQDTLAAMAKYDPKYAHTYLK